MLIYFYLENNMKNHNEKNNVIDLESRRKKQYFNDHRFMSYAEGVWRKLLIMQVLVPVEKRQRHMDMMHFWFSLGLPETATANHVLDRLERLGEVER